MHEINLIKKTKKYHARLHILEIFLKNIFFK
jgi:hypothetical protein